MGFRACFALFLTALAATACGDDDPAAPSSSASNGDSGAACSTPAACPAPEGECHVATCSDGTCGSDVAPAATACGGGACDASGSCAIGAGAWTMHYGFLEGRLATSADRIVLTGDLLGTHDFVGTSVTSQDSSDGYLVEIGRDGQQVGVLATAQPGEDTIQDAVFAGSDLLTVDTRTSDTDSALRIIRRAPDGQTTVVRELLGAAYESFAFAELRITTNAAGDIALVGQLPDEPLTIDGRPLEPATASGMFALVLDAAGAVRWHRAFPGASGLSPVDATFDQAGALVISGVFYQGVELGALSLTAPKYARFVAAFDPSGTTLWARLLEDDRASTGTRLAASPTGGVAVSGTCRGTLRVDGTTVTTASDTQAFVLRLAGDGSTAWSHLDTEAPFENADVTFDAADNVVLCATQSKDADSDPDSFTPWDHLHLAKLAQDGSMLWTKRFGSDDPGPGASCGHVAVSGDLVVVSGAIVGDIDLGSPVTAVSESGSLNQFVAAFAP